MKPLKTKAQIRSEIAQQVDTFLTEGGAVNAVPMGATGRDPGRCLPLPISFDKNQQPRTQVQDVISAIEERRSHKAALKAPFNKAPGRKPRKKMIYDDFGQPLRWQWVEE